MNTHRDMHTPSRTSAWVYTQAKAFTCVHPLTFTLTTSDRQRGMPVCWEKVCPHRICPQSRSISPANPAKEEPSS